MTCFKVWIHPEMTAAYRPRVTWSGCGFGRVTLIMEGTGAWEVRSCGLSKRFWHPECKVKPSEVKSWPRRVSDWLSIWEKLEIVTRGGKGKWWVWFGTCPVWGRHGIPRKTFLPLSKFSGLPVSLYPPVPLPFHHFLEVLCCDEFGRTDGQEHFCCLHSSA